MCMMFCISEDQLNAKTSLRPKNTHHYPTIVWITIAGRAKRHSRVQSVCILHRETYRNLTRQIKCFRDHLHWPNKSVWERAHWKHLEWEANCRQNGRVASLCLTRLLPRPVGGKTATCCFYFEYKKRTSRSRNAATSGTSTLLFLAKTPLSVFFVVVFFGMFSLFPCGAF